ncbi:MAG: DUF3341 domain-containing protein [Chitinophagaceae bacterium]|nr:DUF3341 domain-containing protein [Chitinophagaceae bacterium]
MALKKFVVGVFDDEHNLFNAVRKVRKSGYRLHEVYTPFPLHGLDREMGLRDTSIHTAGFIYGLTGTSLAFGFMTWIFTKDWPLNIGGKPHFALPAWIPIMFEFTVLLSAVGMVLTFCYVCQLAPFVKKHHFHLRSTDDKFVMVLDVSSGNSESEASDFLSGLGASEVNVQVAETGWWLGTYDREQKLGLSREPSH